MSRWFRFYTEALDDPKVQMLTGDEFKLWVNLLCLASKGNGELTVTDAVAFALRVTLHDLEEATIRLANRGLLDATPRGYEPHNWNKRQYKSDTSNERVQRHRDTKRNVTVTPPENTDTEKKEPNGSLPEASSGEGESPSSGSSRKRQTYPPPFEEFWKGYPTSANMSKKMTYEAWKRLNTHARADAFTSLPAFRAYCESHPDYQPVYADRYLKQRRFEGHLETQAKINSRVFVEHGSTEWVAWSKYRGAPISIAEHEGKRGWWFDTQWPPEKPEKPEWPELPASLVRTA